MTRPDTKRLIALPFLVFTLLAWAASASGDDRACDGSKLDVEALRGQVPVAHTSPPNPSGPTEVEFNLQITDLRDIDELESQFRFEGYGDFRWCDPRAAFVPGAGEDDLRRYFGVGPEVPVWNANLAVANGVGAVNVTRRVVEVHADGSVRAAGFFNARVSAPFDLRRFPFDRQTLEIEVESFTYNEDELRLVSDDSRVGRAVNLNLPDWRLGEVNTRVDSTLNVRDRRPFSRIVVSIDIEREWGFYVYKLWLPLFLIVALSWSIFWMTDESLAGRIRISSTAFLTVVAYQFAISGNLPKVEYLTLMDRLMISSFFLIALSAIQSVPVSRLQATNPAAATRLDDVSKWLFPLAYLVVVFGIALTY